MQFQMGNVPMATVMSGERDRKHNFTDCRCVHERAHDIKIAIQDKNR